VSKECKAKKKLRVKNVSKNIRIKYVRVKNMITKMSEGKCDIKKCRS